MKDNIVSMMVDVVLEAIRLPIKDIELVPPTIASKIDTHLLKGVGKLENRFLILIDLGKILPEEAMLMME